MGVGGAGGGAEVISYECDCRGLWRVGGVELWEGLLCFFVEVASVGLFLTFQGVCGCRG